MTFEEAELQYRELEDRWRRGELPTWDDFTTQVSQFAVQDYRGVWWEIQPRSRRWMYFEDSEWHVGTPPGRADPSVLPNEVTTAPGVAPSRPVKLRTRKPAASLGDADRGRTTGAGQSSPRPFSWASELFGGDPRGVVAVIVIALVVCSVLAWLGAWSVLDTMKRGMTAAPTSLFSVPTFTPAPTIVRLPTESSPGVTRGTVSATVIEAQVNVRVAPSVNATILGKIQKGDRVALIGRNEDGHWYQFIYREGSPPAWVFGETLQVTQGATETLPVVRSPAP